MEATYINLSLSLSLSHTHTHTHNGILLSHKEEWNFAICHSMDEAGEYYTVK